MRYWVDLFGTANYSHALILEDNLFPYPIDFVKDSVFKWICSSHLRLDYTFVKIIL